MLIWPIITASCRDESHVYVFEYCYFYFLLTELSFLSYEPRRHALFSLTCDPVDILSPSLHRQGGCMQLHCFLPIQHPERRNRGSLRRSTKLLRRGSFLIIIQSSNFGRVVSTLHHVLLHRYRCKFRCTKSWNLQVNVWSELNRINSTVYPNGRMRYHPP